MAYNVEVLRGDPRIPLLYDAGVVYRLDPPDEPWFSIPRILTRGAGDCEDLACWYAASLRVLGWRALRPGDVGYEVAQDLRPGSIRAAADIIDYGPGWYHCVTHFELGGQVLREDPSARLGMRNGQIDPVIRGRWQAAGVHPKQPPRWK